MNDQVSFTCGACQATLSIPAEHAGISGPCPYCATVVTSPRPAPVIRPSSQNRQTMAPEQESRPWFEAQLMTQEETVIMRPRRIALKVAALAAVFVGGVAGLWKLWEPEAKAESGGITVREARPVARPFAEPTTPRPEVLASAEEGLLPPPADKTPQPAVAPVPSAVAHNVSTGKPSTPGPVSPVISPGVKTPDASPPPAAVPSGPMSAEEKEIREVVPSSGHLEKPGTALIRFFAAKTWQERLKYCLAPEKVSKLMEAYYKEHADGPIVPEDMELTRMEPMEDDPKRHYYAFIIFMPGKEEGVPVSVEETKAGCLVEWSTFIEGKDGLLNKFYKAYQKGPQTFRVLVRRGHYFGDDVPNQDRRSVFDLSPPDGTGPYKLWIDKDSVAYSKHFATGDRTRWEISSMMVVTLEWEKTETGATFVRLRDIVADTWHPGMLPK